ncbi:MAG: uroporphyrinogen-III C-methyltransferase [Rubrivivax sp.]
MSEPNAPAPLPETPASPTSPASPAGTAPPAPAAPAAAPAASRWPFIGTLVLTGLSVAALTLAWNTQQRLRAAELEMVKRQQDAGAASGEARTLARQAEATVREVAAKQALLEARVAETSLQRSQIEELIQSLSRSRDENLLADIDASVRVAMQQATITGSVEPLAASLRQAEERLARYSQPRLERVRRAVLLDLDRLKAASQVDLPSLAIRLDETIRLVEDLPLVSAVDRRPGRAEARAAAQGGTAAPAESASAPAATASAPAAASAAQRAWAWPKWLGDNARAMLLQFWGEVRALVRVTRVDDPDAALLAPDQAFFVRENVKLRLLNARLALMSRQFDIAQADLRDAQSMIDRYFDRSSRRVVLASDQVRQIAAQARQVTLPRPDATLAALATAVAGR